MALNRYMHPRNRYRDNRPNFVDLAEKYPAFRRHTSVSLTGKVSVDFRDPEALRELTCTLLREDFGIALEIPLDRLIPTVPLRLNYILWIEDLLAESGHHGSDSEAIYGVDIVFDAAPSDMLCGVLESSPRQLHHFTMCNPPFFGNILEAQGIMTTRSADRPEPSSVSTAAEGEMVWEEGGEVDFVTRMIEDSLKLRERVVWYTTMIGKKASLAPLKKELAKYKIRNVTTTEFCQGRTMRWGIAWTFYDDIKPPISPSKRLKNDKERPPLTIEVPSRYVRQMAPAAIENQQIVDDIARAVENILTELEIDVTREPDSKHSAQYTLTASRNTWSNQRRKRRCRKVQSCRHGDEESVSTSNDLEHVNDQTGSLDGRAQIISKTGVCGRECDASNGESTTNLPSAERGSSVNTHKPKTVCDEFANGMKTFSEAKLDSCRSRQRISTHIGGRVIESATKSFPEIGPDSCVATQAIANVDREKEHCDSGNEIGKISTIEHDSCGARQGAATQNEKRQKHPKRDGNERPSSHTDPASSGEAGSPKTTECLFKCGLAILVSGGGEVSVEMRWMEGKTRDSMHQVGQYLTNQFGRN